MLNKLSSTWMKVKAPFQTAAGSVLAELPSAESYPTDEELNAEPELNQHIAHHIRAQYDRNHALAIQASVDVSKWLLTSMLAVNAGGAVAVTQLEIEPVIRVTAGALYVAGIILPLLSGHLSTMNGMKLGGPMGKVLGYWAGVEFSGERSRDAEIELNRLAGIAFSYMRWPYRLGAASIIMFVAGSVVVGLGVLRSL